MDSDVPYGTFDYLSNLSSIIEMFEADISIMPILSYFVLRKHLSSYQIFKKEISYNDNLIYRSTNKKVKRLLDLNLIERIKDDTQLSEAELKRNAKYYKLTEQGLLLYM